MRLRHRSLAALAPIMLLACAPAAAATIEVTKSASCGCCTGWVEHLRKEGFTVKVTDVEDPGAKAKALGVPDQLRSCHTSEIAGYVVEGHVPASDIKKLLAQKPKVTGLALPGMPLGSPGMDTQGAKQPYATLSFDRAGKSKVFAQH